MTSLMTNLFSVFVSQQSQKKIINKSNIATLPAAEMAFLLNYKQTTTTTIVSNDIMYFN